MLRRRSSLQSPCVAKGTLELLKSVSSAQPQLSPRLALRRPTPVSIHSNYREQSPGNPRAIQSVPGSVRARGAGGVRQVAGKGVATQVSSHGRTRAWVPRQARTGADRAAPEPPWSPGLGSPAGAHLRAGDAADPLQPAAAGERRRRQIGRAHV